MATLALSPPSGVLALAVATAGAARRPSTDDPKQAGRDSQAIQDCIKSVKGAATKAERCIGSVADPCLKRPGCGLNCRHGCVYRAAKLSVWDDILNETDPAGSGDKLDAEQKVKLRDMQRAWIDSRDRTCAFY